MSTSEKNNCEKEEAGIFKIAAMLLLFIGFVAGAAAVTVFVLRRVRDAVAKINKDTDFEPLDGEELSKNGADAGVTVGKD